MEIPPSSHGREKTRWREYSPRRKERKIKAREGIPPFTALKEIK
jgi:hypothetical protein